MSTFILKIICFLKSFLNTNSKSFNKNNHTMDIEKLKKEIASDEGVVYQVYLDHLGYPTFGIGHLLKKTDIEYYSWNSLPKGGTLTISKERVEQVFDEDIKCTLDDCRRLFEKYDSFLEEVQFIIANMMFNLGYVRLSKFKKFIKAINNNNFFEAAKEMKDSKWYSQVTNRANRLIKRMLALHYKSIKEALS